MFEPLVIESIKRDAIEKFPNESCGIVLTQEDGGHKYLALPNLATEPSQSFHVDERVLIGVGDALAAVVHSHPNGPDCPSGTDMRQQVAWKVPFGIVSTDGEGCLEPFFWGDTVPVPELIGRGFRHGVTDCYALCRDYYRLTHDLILREYPRDWEWWTKGQRMYEDFFQNEGFHRIEEREVRSGDAFMAQIRSDTPNHAGIYVGDGLILHHLTSSRSWDPSRLSRRDPVSGWSKFICGTWVRHETMEGASA